MNPLIPKIGAIRNCAIRYLLKTKDFNFKQLCLQMHDLQQAASTRDALRKRTQLYNFSPGPSALPWRGSHSFGAPTLRSGPGGQVGGGWFQGSMYRFHAWSVWVCKITALNTSGPLPTGEEARRCQRGRTPRRETGGSKCRNTHEACSPSADGHRIIMRQTRMF